MTIDGQHAPPSFGPLAGLKLDDLADLPVGALAHLVRLKADPLYRLAADLPDLAEQLQAYYPEIDFGDPALTIFAVRRAQRMAEDFDHDAPSITTEIRESSRLQINRLYGRSRTLRRVAAGLGLRETSDGLGLTS